MNLGGLEPVFKHAVLATVVAAGFAVGCDTSDSTDHGLCGARQTCGYIDQHFNSTFYCPPAPFVPGGWYGYTWHDMSNCHEECSTAASWGCNAGGCDAGCDVDVGTDAWLACDEANGGRETSSGCFLSESGVNGETVPCACR